MADASDASSPDAADAAVPDAADAASEDAGEDSGEDAAADAAGPFDASAACATLAGANPIQGVLSEAIEADGGLVQINYQSASTTSGSGQAPDGETVTFESWTQPVGVMSSVTVMYWLNADSSNIQSIPLVATSGPSGQDTWAGTLAAQASGTTVTWWVQATDVCHSGTDYYSNSGGNYVYQTQ